jgi:hypothetical protein
MTSSLEGISNLASLIGFDCRYGKSVVQILHCLELKSTLVISKSRDSSVGIALGYGLDDRGSRVRFPVEAGNFSLPHSLSPSSLLSNGYQWIFPWR